MTALRWAAVVVVAIFACDAGLRLLLPSVTQYDLKRSADTKTLLVYFPGILADGVMSSKDFVDELHHKGDVLLVSYTSMRRHDGGYTHDGARFKGDEIAADTAKEIESLVGQNGYTKVVLIGSSMGGLVAYDTYEAMRFLRGVEFVFVLIDAPTKRSDLQAPLDTISLGSYGWWAGPISNFVSGLYYGLTFVEPKEENIEPGVDRARLDESVRAAKSYPLSWGMDQTRYIIGHPPVRPGSLDGVRVIYVRSTRDDDTVRPRAFATWNGATSGHTKHVEVDSTHVGYTERPTTWRAALQGILSRI